MKKVPLLRRVLQTIQRRQLFPIYPYASQSRDGSCSPRDEIERAVADIWQTVLGIEQIGIYDDFFELGGHSLLATTLVARLREAFHTQLPMRSLFNSPTVAAMAAEITQHSTASSDIEPLARIAPDPENLHEPFPLTDVQQAYWVGRAGAFELSNVSAHIYFEVESEGVELKRLSEAWRRLIERHGMLRAVIGADGQQEILREVGRYEIEERDLRGEEASAVAEYLGRVRERMSHQVLRADTWPLFEIRATRLE